MEASVAEYIVLARKNGNDWYIGAMTNEKARELKTSNKARKANAEKARKKTLKKKTKQKQ